MHVLGYFYDNANLVLELYILFNKKAKTNLICVTLTAAYLSRGLTTIFGAAILTLHY